ncbi:hypothetical protein [Mucilaginibacter achroorhodeus]|uniref:hypothetical protein n=1 Tax=Mucilaginibacter achroorhodeus TaxID=2599294 RepID=UPI0016495B6D|nr:hypothetical protein [Mucilaginibacter achroorhodeus]
MTKRFTIYLGRFFCNFDDAVSTISQTSAFFLEMIALCPWAVTYEYRFRFRQSGKNR